MIDNTKNLEVCNELWAIGTVGTDPCQFSSSNFFKTRWVMQHNLYDMKLKILKKWEVFNMNRIRLIGVLFLLMAFLTVSQIVAAEPNTQATSDIMMLTPQNGAAKALTNELLMIHLQNQPNVDKQGELAIYQKNGELFEKISFSSDRIVDLSNSRIIIDPKNDFKPGETYYVTFRTGVGANSVKLDKATDWRFTVGQGMKEEKFISKAMGLEYRLYIGLPENYQKQQDKKYPIVFVTDGGLFNYGAYNLIAEMSAKGEIPEVITVGIGHPKGTDIVHERIFRTWDFVTATEQFRSFVEGELIPYIDQTYRVETNNRTLIGNSLGGYYTLYSCLLPRTDGKYPFKNFLAVAFARDLKPMEERLATTTQALPINLYLSIGTKDIPLRLGYYNQMVTSLQGREYEGFRMQTMMWEGLPHGEVSAIPSFEEGLKALLK